MLLHKAHANWCYLIIAELRPLYDSIPINLRTGSQAELGKKESRWAKRAERGLGERKWREILFWCLQSWVSRCARGTPHPTAGRTGLATVKTDQSEASPQIGDWVVLIPPFSFPTLRLLQNTISLIQGIWFKLWLFFDNLHHCSIVFVSAQSLVKIIECIKGLKFKYAAQSTLPFTSLKTRWELETTSVPQLFLG